MRCETEFRQRQRARGEAARRLGALQLGKLVVLAILIAVVAGSAFAAGYGAGQLRSLASMPVVLADQVPTAQQARFGVFWEVWELIEKNFYTEKPLDDATITQGAIRGMVEALGDSHTAWFDPATAAIMEEDMSGSFEGIGATVEIKDDYLSIVRLLPNSPALKAGLRASDVIVEVDGKSIKGMTMLQAIALVRGPEGTSVRLGVRRQTANGPIQFWTDIRRARITMPTVESGVLPEGIAYLKLAEFNARADREVRQALRTLLEQQPKGLVLDLRDNPGGYLYSAVEIASQFLDKGLVLTERSVKDPPRDYPVKPGGLARDIPLVVLINGFSASASEIVAGAVQDQERGVLIGETSYGKGSIQSTYTLSDNSSLHVTIARWYTPNGHQIDGKGLEPDIVVPRTEADTRAERDPQLDRAITYLLTGK